jgi:hypothetical protein
MSKEKLIIDLALGDGYLTKPKSETAFSGLVIKHSVSQADYLLHKKELLEKEGFKCSIDAYRDTNGFGIIQLRTSKNQIVRNVYNKLYIEGTKTISPAILNHFDAQSLALLFQDDGSREHTKWHRSNGERYAVKPYINAFLLYLNSFSEKELDLIITKMREMGIEARPQKRKGYPVILITKVEAKERFVEVVSPYICPSMQYKIDYPVKYYGRA